MPITLYIDADACPVKDEALRVAERHSVPVFIVSNGGLRPNPHPLVTNVTVDQGADVADDWIAERIAHADICLTSDVPLAARCVEAGGVVIAPDGEISDARNIGGKLATRDLMADLRAANPLTTSGGGRAFSKADRSRFLNALERLITKQTKLA